MVREGIQRALSIVNTLVEGGIDPFESFQAQTVLTRLVEAQGALEEAAECCASPDAQEGF